LRYYDRLGLLSPAQQTEFGHRLYTDADLQILQRILALKSLGFSLEEIQLLLFAPADRIREALARQKTVLIERRNRLDSVLQTLEEAERKMEAEEWDWKTFTQAIQGERTMTNETTLQEALQRLEIQLVRDGRQQFLPLIDESRVKEAIRVAQAAYPPNPPGSRGDAYYRTVVQPLLQGITEDGVWPAHTELDPFYELKDESGVTYQGMGLSVEMVTPEGEFAGFAFSLPVLDVWYGRWV
jgi:DNA-binding transcriptional MerR regulator